MWLVTRPLTNLKLGATRDGNRRAQLGGLGNREDLVPPSCLRVAISNRTGASLTPQAAGHKLHLFSRPDSLKQTRPFSSFPLTPFRISSSVSLPISASRNGTHHQHMLSPFHVSPSPSILYFRSFPTATSISHPGYYDPPSALFLFLPVPTGQVDTLSPARLNTSFSPTAAWVANQASTQTPASYTRIGPMISLSHDFTSCTFSFLSSVMLCKHYTENSRTK